MKLVVNTTFGGFCLPDEFCELHGLERWDDVLRDQPELVSYVEARGPGKNIRRKARSRRNPAGSYRLGAQSVRWVRERYLRSQRKAIPYLKNPAQAGSLDVLRLRRFKNNICFF